MTDPPTSKARYYEIRLRGHLDARWADRFRGLTITLEDNGHTMLTGEVIDQAALHGLLKKVRDLGMPLVSVSPLELGPADASDVKPSVGVGKPPAPKQSQQGEQK